MRSAYLFGARTVRDAWDDTGLDGLYERMYPEGGAVKGYLEAGRSFAASEFRPEARAALEAAVRLGKVERKTGRRRRGDVEQLAEARKALAALLRS